MKLMRRHILCLACCAILAVAVISQAVASEYVWVFIDKTGQVKLGPFEAAKRFSEGLASVKLNGVYFVIDRDGKQVIPPNPRFRYLGRFFNGLARFQQEGKTKGHFTWGYIDKTGKIVTASRFDYAYPFSDKRGLVEIDGKAGYVDQSGRLVIPLRFKKPFAAPFSEGLAAVRSDDGKVGYIDIDGNWIIKPQFYYAGSFTEGLASATVTGSVHGTGYIDKSGTFVIQPKPLASRSRNFHDGLADASDSNLRDIIINKKGEVVFELSSGDALVGHFSEGRAIYRNNKAFGVIDTAGKVVVEAKHIEIRQYSEGLAAFCPTLWWGYIDRQGNIVIEPQFSYALEFSEGLAAVKTLRDGIHK